MIPLLAMMSTAIPHNIETKGNAKVMCLGVFHFANPGLDAAKSEIQSVLSEKRQSEIKNLVEMISKFKPTKIAVEAPLERGEKINAQYRSYVKGDYQLDSNEIDQIGYRMANLFKHPKVYAIDSRLDMNFEAPFTFLAKNAPEEATQFTDLIQKIGVALSQVDRDYTIPQILAIYNTKEAQLQNHRFYVKLAKYTDGKQYPGADMLAEWYQRNVRIYANLRQITEPGDRILVIFGAGHVKMLNDLISESGDLELVNPAKYLPKPPLQKLPINL